MLGGPVQWLDIKTIMAMLPEKVIQRKWLWRLRCLYHSCLDKVRQNFLSDGLDLTSFLLQCQAILGGWWLASWGATLSLD